VDERERQPSRIPDSHEGYRQVAAWEISLAVLAFAFAFALAMGGCCSSPKVTTFTALPPCVAKGGKVNVVWSANRPVTLTASPSPARWQNGQVAPTGNLAVVVDQPTHFELLLPGADPALGQTKPPQDVAVFETTIRESVIGPKCDPASRRVTGPMQQFASCAATVARMSSPTTQDSSARNTPRKVCLVPPTGAEKCADAGGSVDIGAKVDKTWTVSIPLQDGESCGSPNQPTLASMQFEMTTE
jgi:hypothetical protein